MEIYLNGILLVLLICRFILLQQNNTGYDTKFNGDISKWDVKGDCNVSNMFSDSSLEYKAPKWYYDIRSDVEYYD